VLGWVAVATAAVQLIIALLNERMTQPPLVEANRKSIEAQQTADASLRNAQVIEAMGMLRNVHKRWFEKQRDFLNKQALASDKAGVFASLSKLMQTVTGSALLGLSCWLMMNGSLGGDGSLMIVASILGGMMLKPLVQMVTTWRSFVNARDAWRRLSALMTALPARPGAMPLPPPRGTVVAEALVVAAPGTQASILRGVQFSLNPGEVLAVIGPSAAGKTTLARVLAGLWSSMGGKARLDGVDLFTWDKTELGPHVGYLPQGVELFDGSIADNIARFGNVDRRKVEAAARTVGLHDFILSLPAGYDTDVGPEGARLSGGQRQRIGLARALYGDPVFVLLDEPNSSLDEAGDAILNDAIARHKASGTTFVVITHRTGLLKVVDKILLLRDGQTQAFGPRDDVLAALQKAQQGAVKPAQGAQGAQGAPA
jgi:ATP-binding cassette subfamily C exporter for protease/lipase